MTYVNKKYTHITTGVSKKQNRFVPAFFVISSIKLAIRFYDMPVVLTVHVCKYSNWIIFSSKYIEI